MRTYAIRNARTKTTGHYRQPGTRTTFCNRPVGIPNGDFLNLTGWKMCTRCVKAEQRDRAHAVEVAAQFAEPLAPAEVTRASVDAYLAREYPALAAFRAADRTADREAAAAEALFAAQLVTEAEATAGTWRGEWIGQAAADGALFTLTPDREQGALFA
ncbi:hypothetical protein [Streptomyces sp900116325]|uniref:hypothetical protein n=1 Tax=Streptomyces sp. 900116325 TaxID=3154295 RepID=UPI0033A8A896